MVEGKPLALRVLLAEDEPISQLVTRAMLEKLGCEVVTASSGLEVIRAHEAADFDVVLMDVMMPEMNGYETTAIIRNAASSERKRSIPIVALTANASKADRQRCMEAGMDDFLSKPFDPHQLLDLLKRWKPESGRDRRR